MPKQQYAGTPCICSYYARSLPPTPSRRRHMHERISQRARHNMQTQTRAHYFSITTPSEIDDCRWVIHRLLTDRIVDRRSGSDLDRIPIPNLPGTIEMAILWRAINPILF
jgi:hypothetical protein